MPEINTLARWLLVLGFSLLAIGAVLWVLGKTGLPLGRLPGDLHFQIGGATCWIPLVSSILLSILLTLALNILSRLVK